MSTPQLTARSFVFDFPAHTAVIRIVEEGALTGHRRENGNQGPSSTSRKARRRILVIDDEDLFRGGLVLKLRNVYHASVEEAETGSMAIEKLCAAGSGYDLILMDVSLPDTSGDKLYIEIRALGVDSPIAFMSAFEENRAVAQALGVPFLDKPIDDAALERLFVEYGGEPVS